MKRLRRVNMAPLLLTFILGPALSLPPASHAAETLNEVQIETLVNENLGKEAKAAGAINPAFPRYMRVRLTGAPDPVLLLPVFVDQAKGKLDARGVRAINLPGQDGGVDENIGTNCMGLAFFHGIAATSKPGKPSSVHMLYECFSGYSRVAKGAPMLKPLRPRAVGEAILLDLETGGQVLIYWSAKGYRTKTVRAGD